MNWISDIYYVFQIFFLIILSINVLYHFVFSLASLFPIRLHLPQAGSYRKIAILIPGYKEDNVMLDVAKDALNQDYPREKYDVVVIADSFAETTIAQLKEMPVKLIEVSFDKSTKSKALNQAMSLLPDDYDVAVVLDADNIMIPGFLSQINNFFASKPDSAVQGHRVPKNANTPFAVLDGISEEIGNQMFRKGHAVLGLSSGIVGSGMAFGYTYFKNTMAKIKAVSGFDKELEIIMLKERHRVYYLPDALVYDEKVQNADAFSKQRRRWLFSQYYYLRIAFVDALTGLITRGDFNFFNKVFQWIMFPRIIIIGLMCVVAPLFVLLELLVFQVFITPVWIILFSVFILTFVMAIPKKYYNRQTLSAIGYIPQGAFLMFKTFFSLKGANKNFIHTPHGAVEENQTTVSEINMIKE